MIDPVSQIISNIKFDKDETVIGDYYGRCPMCGKNRNLTFDRGTKWVCRKCYYK